MRKIAHAVDAPLPYAKAITLKSNLAPVVSEQWAIIHVGEQRSAH
jgi:hypothetical protein